MIQTPTTVELIGSSTPSWCPQPLHSTVAELNEFGSQLYLSGEQSQALAIFQSALKTLRSTTSTFYTTRSKHKTDTKMNGLKLKKPHHEVVLASPPDTYLEGECDIGPRLIRSPLHLDQSGDGDQDNNFLHLTVLFNTALALHSNSYLEEALESYIECTRLLDLLLNRPDVSTFIERLSHFGMILYNNVGHLFYCIGNEEAAESHFAQSLLWAQKSTLDDSCFQLHLATTLSNHGRTKWMLGSIDEETYKQCENVLHLRASVLPVDHIDVICARYNIGIMAYARNERDTATEHLQAYLAAACITSKENILDPIPAISYIILMQTEDNDDALSHELVRAIRALQDKREDLGSEHAEVASLLNYIGTILFHRRELESAILFYKEELKLEETLDSNTPGLSVSVTYNNIGRILQELGQLPEAIGCYRQALKSELTSRGSEHVQAVSLAEDHSHIHLDPNTSDATKNLVSTIWYNMGLIYDRMGSRPDAISAFQISLEMRRILLGKDHPDVACLWFNIGTLEMEQHQMEKAELALHEALRIQRLGGFLENPEHAINSLQKLGTVQKARSDIIGALNTFHEMANIQESMQSTCAFGVTLRSIADLYHAQGDLQQALKFASQSCHEMNKCYQYDSLFSNAFMTMTEDLARSLLLMGSLLHESCESIQANDVYIKAWNFLEAARIHSGGFLSPSLEALKDVSLVLSSLRCAPAA